MLVVLLCCVKREQRDRVVVGQLAENPVTPDSSSDISRYQAARLDPENSQSPPLNARTSDIAIDFLTIADRGSVRCVSKSALSVHETARIQTFSLAVCY